MQKTKAAFRLLIQLRIVGPDFLEKTECAAHVGANKIVGAEDGSIYMALGGKVDHCTGLSVAQQAANEVAIGDVAVFKAVTAGTRDRLRFFRLPA